MEEDGTESEQISDSFVCAVCLDLLYKPIVLACGHISCFWCVFKSMSLRRESHCPICRHAYQHFPSICQMLHFLLFKIYPITYKRRENQILEVEKKTLDFSPDLDSPVATEIPDPEYEPGESSALEGVKMHSRDAVEEKKLHHRSVNGTHGQVSVTDLLCTACKQLLYRPIVLNCGHVFCEACIVSPANEMLKCQLCKSPHPRGFPKVCLVLDHFVEEQFSYEYAQRRTAQLKEIHNQKGTSTTGSIEDSKKGCLSSFPTDENFFQWLVENGSNFHAGVGCDSCGMTPIIGDRYKCKDCTAKMGFDLCGDCYNTSSKHPGRFNQQHTPEHRFEKLKPQFIPRLFRGNMAYVLAAPYAATSPETPENTSPSNDVEGGLVSPGSPTDGIEDQAGNQTPL